MDFVCGGLAASGASVLSNPFDVLKTRMQLQGEMKAKGQYSVRYKNVIQGVTVVAKNDGLKGLQKGLGVAMILHGARNCFRLGIYQTAENRGLLRNEKGQTIFHRSALASAFAGCVGAFFGSPLFLIKTQLQSQAAKTIAVGHQHGHKSAILALKTIYQQNGIFGLWRGVGGTMIRAFVGSSAQLTSFSMSKDKLREYEIFKKSPTLSTLVASIIGGIVQTLMINPFDVVSTRLYNQGVDSEGRGLLYNSVIDCFGKILRAEGVNGLYKGVVANYMRFAPHSLFTLLFWDILKDFKNKYIDTDR